MKIFKRYKQEVNNKAGLTFELEFKQISKRLTVRCLNPPEISFRYSIVEEVMNPLKIKKIDNVIVGIVYKCHSLECFQQIIKKIQEN